MKGITKIIFGITLLFIIIGTAYAAHNNEIFIAPNGLHAMGYNDFVDEKGHNIMIMEDTEEHRQIWFENDTEANYLVEPYSGNNNLYLGADDENDCYILEIVEKDGIKYIVASWTPKGAGEASTIYNNLLDFNQLNHVTPLPIEE